MKKIILGIVCSIVFGSVLNAQNENVISIDLNGDTYTVSQDFPQEIDGKYLYEGKGEPIVLLNTADGTGLFQFHLVPANKIRFWIDCDESGVIRKYYRSAQEEAAGNYRYTLLYQYMDGERTGDYDLMEVSIRPDLGIIQILGEREKPL